MSEITTPSLSISEPPSFKNEKSNNTIFTKAISAAQNQPQQSMQKQSDVDNTKSNAVQPISNTTKNVSASETENTDLIVDKVADEFENLKVFGNKTKAEIQRVQANISHLSSGMNFTDPSLKIPIPIVESLTIDMRFDQPSHIQAVTIPLIMDHQNIIAQAQSGSGKTLPFCIGMLASLDVSLPQPQALCIAPTRELALLIIKKGVMPLSSRMPQVRYEQAVPGADIEKGSRCSSHIIVGTPGTISHWVSSGYINLATMKVFAVDEADKMVEEASFGADTKKICKKLDPRCQLLFFSATFSPVILEYTKKLVPRAKVVRLTTNEELVLDVIFQIRMDVRNKILDEEDNNTKIDSNQNNNYNNGYNGGRGGGRGYQGGRGSSGRGRGGNGLSTSSGSVNKLAVLKSLYEMMSLGGQSIVFVETVVDVERIAEMMTSAGFEVSPFHGKLDPQIRDQRFLDFTEGRSSVLIATDALARGVDIPAIQMVVNYDLPKKKMGTKMVCDADTYLHRIG
eukprot:gene7567-10309_t